MSALRRHPLLVVGLGNQGREFEYTRHNVGRTALDYLVKCLGLTWTHQHGCEIVTFPPSTPPSYLSSSASPSLSAFLKQCPEGLTFVRLPGFINLSGRPLNRLVSSYGTQPPSILLVHDDLERKFGHVSIKKGGSANGHRGVQSVQLSLGSSIHRLRIGIGRPESHSRLLIQSYVLSNFKSQELDYFKTEGYPTIWNTLLTWAQQESLEKNFPSTPTSTSVASTITPTMTSEN